MAIQGTQNNQGIVYYAQRNSELNNVDINIAQRNSAFDAYEDVENTEILDDLPDFTGVVNITNNTFNVTGTVFNNLLNIEAFGAIRNGESTQAIQNCITAAYASGCGIYVPGYAYHITGTLEFPYKVGGRIVGAGGNQEVLTVNPDNVLLGSVSRFIWTGATSQPNQIMCKIHGEGLSWDGIHLWGSSNTGATVPNVTGILITKEAGGLAPGQHLFKQIGINYCAVGVCISPSGDYVMANCEQTVWDVVYMYDTPIGFLINSQQAMGHYINYLSFQRAYTKGHHAAVQTTNAGCVYVDSMFSFGSGVRALKIVGPGPGHNNGMFVFKNIKFDDGAQNAKLLDMTDWRGSGSLQHPVSTIRFENVKLSYEDYENSSEQYLVDVYGGCRVILDNIDKIQTKAIVIRTSAAGTEKPNISVINSSSWTGINSSQTGITGIFDAARSSGTYYWSVRNTSHFYGTPYRDTGNYVL